MYHPTFDSAAKAADDALKANKDHIFGLRVRCIATKQANGWESRICAVLGYGKQHVPTPKSQNLDYGSTLLSEAWLEPRELAGFLRKIASGLIDLNGVQVQIPNLTSWQEDRVSSQNDYCDEPARVFRATPHVAKGAPEQALIHYTMDCYPSIAHATKAWIEFPRASLDSHGNAGTVLLVLPEYRASFLGFTRKGAQLIVSAEGSTSSERPLVLQVTWVEQGRVRHGRYELEQAKITVPVPPTATEAYLWLIDEKCEILDFYQEFLSLGPLEKKIFRSDSDSNGTQSVSEAIREGEGKYTEFKPFIDLENQKIEEVVETVIAFANTEGGQVLIGVDRYSRVEGVNTRAIAAARRGGHLEVQGESSSAADRQLALDWYTAGLRTMIRDRVVPDIDLGIGAVEIAGNTVVVVRVPAGRNTPYSRRGRSGGIWVRHGASNVFPDPNTDWRRLIGGPSQFPSIL
jgi:hypothetical protein